MSKSPALLDFLPCPLGLLSSLQSIACVFVYSSSDPCSTLPHPPGHFLETLVQLVYGLSVYLVSHAGPSTVAPPK